jgi:hypothetical protein
MLGIYTSKKHDKTTMLEAAHDLIDLESMAIFQNRQFDVYRQDWSAYAIQNSLERTLGMRDNKMNSSLHKLKGTDPSLVTWSGQQDPANPRNWSKASRWAYTFTIAATSWTVTFAACTFSAGTRAIIDEFSVGPRVATFGTLVFALGFGLHLISWIPLSELYGRKPPLLLAFGIFIMLQIPETTAKNAVVIIASRSLSGVFGAATLVISGKALVDIWKPVEQRVAIPLFATAICVSLIAVPVMSALAVQRHLGCLWALRYVHIMFINF